MPFDRQNADERWVIHNAEETINGVTYQTVSATRYHPYMLDKKIVPLVANVRPTTRKPKPCHVLIDCEVVPIPMTDTAIVMCDLLRYELLWEFKQQYKDILKEEATQRLQQFGSACCCDDIEDEDENTTSKRQTNKQPLWFALKVLGESGECASVMSGGIRSQAVDWLLAGKWPKLTAKTLLHAVRGNGMQFPSVGAFLQQVRRTEFWFQWDQVVQEPILHKSGTTIWAKGMQLEKELLQPHGLHVRELVHPLAFEAHLYPPTDSFLHLPWEEVVVMESVTSVVALTDVMRQQDFLWRLTDSLLPGLKALPQWSQRVLLDGHSPKGVTDHVPTTGIWKNWFYVDIVTTTTGGVTRVYSDHKNRELVPLGKLTQEEILRLKY